MYHLLSGRHEGVGVFQVQNSVASGCCLYSERLGHLGPGSIIGYPLEIGIGVEYRRIRSLRTMLR